MHLNGTSLNPIQKTGELLIGEGLVRREDVGTALNIQVQEAQAEKRTGRTIGGILCDLDLVSPIDLSRVLRKYQKQLRLGEIMLREGVIDSGQLEEALYDQQLHMEPLGHILIRKNRIRMDQLYSALSVQYNIPFRRLDGFAVNAATTGDLTRIIGKDDAEENLVLPISLEGVKLTLGVYAPEKMMNIHKLRAVYPYLRMDCVLIRPDKFHTLFAQLYGTSIRAAAADMPEPAILPRSPENPEPESELSPEPSCGRTTSGASRIVNDLVKHAINAAASSIHIEQDFNGTTIRYRINGVLEAVSLPWLEDGLSPMAGTIVKVLKSMAGLNENDARRPQNGIFHLRFAAKENGETLDFCVRLAACPTIHGENVTLLISGTPGAEPHLDDLQHSFQVLGPLKKILDEPGGILLFSGPPGSGKQTTLYSAASYLLRPEIKVIAIDETFPHSIPGMVKFQADPGRNLGTETLFRMAPSHDPDVILLSNLSDPETASAVFDISQTGPFVLSGIVADDALDTLLQLRELGIRPGRIAQSLKAVFAQRQVRKICSVCKERYIPPPDLWQALFTQYPANVPFFRAIGCKSCRFTGYNGFLVISEFLTIDRDLVAALAQDTEPSVLRQVAVGSGFRTMAEDARLKLNRTTIEALLETSARLFKTPETPVATDRFGPVNPSPSMSPDDFINIPFRKKTWTLLSIDPRSAVFHEMYETYRVLNGQTGSRSASGEKGLFYEFIAASFHHICRQYACSEVTFSIENRQGRPEVTASPVRNVHQDR
jgi:type IV pilus assembly protein PilB